MIEFGKLTIEGYGSIRDELIIDLETNGVNIVLGKNGSGKTTIFNALSFVLYNLNLKGLKASQLATKLEYRTNSWRGTRVIVEIYKGDKMYHIARHIKFKGETLGINTTDNLLVFEDAELTTDQYKGDSQEFINKLLGLDSKLFLNSILFGQRMKRFIESKPTEKREIFESIFDLSYIETAKSNAELEYTKKNKEVDELIRIQDKNNNTIDHIRSSIDNIKNSNEQSKLSKESKINNNTKDIIHYNSIIKELVIHEIFDLKEIDNDCITKLLELDIKLVDINRLINETIQPIKIKDEDLTSEELRQFKRDLLILDDNSPKPVEQILYPSKITTVCNTCSQNLPKLTIEKLRAKYNKEVKKLEDNHLIETNKYNEYTIEFNESYNLVLNQIKDCTESLIINNNKSYQIIYKTYQTALESYQSDKENILTNIDRLKKLNDDQANNIIFNKLQSDNKTINDTNNNTKDRLSKLIISLESENDLLAKQILEINDDNIKSYEKDIKDLLSINEHHENNILKLNEKLENINWWVKTGFSNKGFKSYILDAALTQLNETIKKYSSRLGIGIVFSVDIKKASKPFLTKCYLNNIELDYDEFSGGEKARIDVATAFAIHDIVSSTVKFNILIMDEIFEGLDDQGIDEVFDLIRMKAVDKSIYVITHSSHIDSLNTQSIQVIKENGTTTIDI